MSQVETLNIDVSCSGKMELLEQAKITPAEKFDQLYNLVEDFKRKVGAPNPGSYPVIGRIINNKTHPVADVIVKLNVLVKASNHPRYEAQPITVNLSHSGIKPKHAFEVALFDAGGLDIGVIQVLEVQYVESGRLVVNDGMTQNTPFLIEMQELTNKFGGFKDNDELETFFVLKNYIDQNLFLRGILLNMMYSDRKAIDDNTYLMFGEKVDYSPEQLTKVRALIQVDIIARIMMYIEDYIVLLLGNLTSAGNYYRLLDRQARDDPDLGDRMGQFMTRLDSKTNPFTIADYCNMLGYLNPRLVNLDSKEKAVLINRTEQNCIAIRDFLLKLKAFAADHRQIFRRYKHAGFAVAFDAISKPPYNGTFDSHAIVMEGPSPLHDVKSLPYSEEVFKAYSAIIRTLQEFIFDVAQNKISSLERNSPGIVPFENYTADSQDDDIMSSIINKFWQAYPLRARNHHFQINFSDESKLVMDWYKNLDQFFASTYYKKQDGSEFRKDR